MMKHKFRPLTEEKASQLKIGKLDEPLIFKEEIIGTPFTVTKTRRGIKLKIR